MRRIATPATRLPLHDSAASRRIEQAALAAHPPFALMARAGLASARWALALAPHAQRLWVAAGPGNNGGDGLVLARWWRQLGRTVHVSLHADPERLPNDAREALRQAREAGVSIGADSPSWQADLTIDALLGLGQHEAPRSAVLDGVRALGAQSAPVLSLDLPTGLCADRGRVWGEAVRAQATLSLLTLKPGLFTAAGRDLAGQVWWDDLGCGSQVQAVAASAELLGQADVAAAVPERHHASHKGRYGDCWVIGGGPGMSGAARLAARAALRAGAGRVFLCGLDPEADDDSAWPELMHRTPGDLHAARTLAEATVVCGCGGGSAVAALLPVVLTGAARLVLDADALNAVAADPMLQTALARRGAAGRPTVLTPHPLEAARLLGDTVGAVQADRPGSAQALAERFAAVVVLKGSGSLVAAPGQTPSINPSGNARLATAGSGDVLAGWLGGTWSALGDAGAGLSGALRATRGSVCRHGLAAEALGPADPELPLPAARLVDALAQRRAG